MKRKQCGMAELMDFDYDFGNFIKRILEFKGNIEELGFNVFEYRGQPVVENGQNIVVTNENKNQYLNHVIDFVFNQSIQSHFDSFMSGFLASVGSDCLDLFTSEELQLLYFET